jgi:nicotinate dehydrogenase subunit A
MPLAAAAGKDVTTLEGLGDRDRPHALQDAFIREQALQCGYCGNGVLMAAAALLAGTQRPTEGQIRAALEGHLCRCGAQPRIIKAIMRAAESQG